MNLFILNIILKMKPVHCALCGLADYQIIYKENFSGSDLNKKTFSARRIPEKVHLRIVKCNHCGLIYSNPLIPPELLKNLYSESAYNYDFEEIDLGKTYGHYIREASINLKKKENYLDIGCGNGFMLGVAQKVGFKNVFGVEPSTDALKKAKPEFRKNIKNGMFKKGLFEKNYFDLITIFQTLDHISDPNLFLKNVYEILAPGGAVLAYNHNVNSLSAKLLGENSPIFDIEHAVLYDKKTISQIFQKNGFQTVWAGGTFNIFPLSYWLRMFPLPTIIKDLLLPLVSTGPLKNVHPKIYGVNLAIIATKRK